MVGSAMMRTLTVDELERVVEIDVSEDGALVYRMAEGELESTPEEWHRPPRPLERWRPLIDRWAEMLRAGGTAVGATEGERLVGIAVHRPRLTPDTSELAGLFVSRERRRSGIARDLVREVINLARAGGATRLYVSATPSASAVGFYLAMGFEPAAEPHPELLALEPEDIHMELRLDGQS
jgi:GNAT superfamily N-acetyltransferase